MKEIGLINVDSFNREVMTSKEIAELTGKNHADVMRDIRNILSQLPENQRKSKFELTYYKQKLPNGGCKEQPMYKLDKKACLLLASGYNALLREKIINRWEELEKREQENLPKLPGTYLEALEELVKKEKEKQILLATAKAQQSLLIENKPKVLFAEAVQTSKRSCLISELAKIICQNGVEMGQNRLFTWLRVNGYLCTKGEYYNQPTQRAIEMGLFEVKKTSVLKPDGTVLICNTTKVTGKGQIYFVNKFITSKTRNYEDNRINRRTSKGIKRISKK